MNKQLIKYADLKIKIEELYELKRELKTQINYLKGINPTNSILQSAVERELETRRNDLRNVVTALSKHELMLDQCRDRLYTELSFQPS